MPKGDGLRNSSIRMSVKEYNELLESQGKSLDFQLPDLSFEEFQKLLETYDSFSFYRDDRNPNLWGLRYVAIGNRIFISYRDSEHCTLQLTPELHKRSVNWETVLRCVKVRIKPLQFCQCGCGRSLRSDNSSGYAAPCLRAKKHVSKGSKPEKESVSDEPEIYSEFEF